MTKRPHAFISYSHTDQDFAVRLVEALPGLGIEPWMDREGIRAGDRWSAAIQQARDSTDVLVLILSPASMASSNVADEWQYALDKGKPVLVDPAARPIARMNLAKSRSEFQMLLGVAETMRGGLVDKGHALRVYVPFGERWHAYSMRRLRENPGIAMHIVRNLFTRR